MGTISLRNNFAEKNADLLAETEYAGTVVKHIIAFCSLFVQ